MTLFSSGARRDGQEGLLRVARESGFARKAADAAFFARHPKLAEAGYHPLAVLRAGPLESLLEKSGLDRERLRKLRTEYWELLREAELLEQPQASVAVAGGTVARPPETLSSCSIDWIRISGERGRGLRLPFRTEAEAIANPERQLAVLAKRNEDASLSIVMHKRTGAGLCNRHRKDPLLVTDPVREQVVFAARSLTKSVALAPDSYSARTEDLLRTFAPWAIEPRRYLIEARACETAETPANVLVYPSVLWDLDLTVTAAHSGPAPRGHVTWRAAGKTVDLLEGPGTEIGAALAELEGLSWCQSASDALNELSQENSSLGSPVVRVLYRSRLGELPGDWRVGVEGRFELAFDPLLSMNMDRDVTPVLLNVLRSMDEAAVLGMLDKLAVRNDHIGATHLVARGRVAGKLFAIERPDPEASWSRLDGKDLTEKIPLSISFSPKRPGHGFWRLGVVGEGPPELIGAAITVDWSDAMIAEDNFLDTMSVKYSLTLNGLTLSLGNWVGIGSTWAPFGHDRPERHYEKIDRELIERHERGAWLERAARRFHHSPAPSASFGTIKLLEPTTEEGQTDLLWAARAIVESLGGRS